MSNESKPNADPKAPADTEKNPHTEKARQNARALLDHCQSKMAQLKTDVGKTAGDHMDIMFGHGKSLLADKLEPMDLIRNSTAVSLNAVDALHRLYEAAYRFFQPR